jgi:glycosyltransferase
MALSIITATLNSDKTLKRTLDSINFQNELFLYHVFVDGGSTDETLEIIDSYIRKNPNIKVILINQKDNSGIYGAWNLAIDFLICNTPRDSICFILNSDDWLVDGAIESVYDIFIKEPAVGIVAGSANIHIEDKDLFVRGCRSMSLFPFFMPVIDPSSFVRISVYMKQGVYNDRYKVAGDYDFHYRCFLGDVRYHFLNFPLINIAMGGFAERNKDIAMHEAYEISKVHSNKAFAIVAFLYRFLRFPRLNWFDKL